MTPKEMREKRARLITEARAKRDEITANTDEARAAELETQFDAMITEAEALEARAKKEENLARLEASLDAGDERRPGGGDERRGATSEPEGVTYREAFHRMMEAGGDIYALQPEVRQVLLGGRVDLSPEQRAQTAGNAAAGGNLVPDEAMREIVKAMAAWGPMFDDNFAQVIKTTGGGSMPIPGVDDTAARGSAEQNEGNPLPNDGSGDVVFTRKTLEDFLVYTPWVAISVQLASGGMENMETLLGQLLGERLGRTANAKLTTGSGAGEAQGIVTGATPSGVAVAGAAAVSSDELLDLYHSVDPAYRASPKFGMMFNDNTLSAIHKLRDGDGRYLVDEAPDGSGRIKVGAVRARYTVNQAMPNMAANARSIIAGDMGKYYVRKIGGVILGTDRSAAFWPGFGIAGYTRFDGVVADAKAIKALVHPGS